MKINWANMWSMESPVQPQQSQEQEEVSQRLAELIVKRGLAVPALVMIDSLKPLSFLGSQLLVFLQPLLTLAADPRQYVAFRDLLADRQQVEVLLDKIETLSQAPTSR